MSPKNDTEQGVITGFLNTESGEIAFANTKNYGTITFGLSLNVWHSTGSPAVGEIVVLSELTKYKQGWRAMKARRFVLNDESINSQM